MTAPAGTTAPAGGGPGYLLHKFRDDRTGGARCDQMKNGEAHTNSHRSKWTAPHFFYSSPILRVLTAVSPQTRDDKLQGL